MNIKALTYIILILATTSKCFSQRIKLELKTQDKKEANYIKYIEYTKEHKNVKSIINETLRIKKRLQENGYINSQLNNIEKINDSLFIQEIQLNKRYKHITITYNNKLVSEKKMRKKLNKATIITDKFFRSDFKNLEKNIKSITEIISEKGGVFNNVKLTELKTYKKKLEVHATLQITKKKNKTISDIKIKGYKKFPKKFTKHYLKLKKGTNLELSELKIKSNKINKLLFAEEIKEPEILFTKDTTTIYLYIKKRNTNKFDGFLGFSSNEESKIELNGNINLSLNNNLNTGEELTINYKTTENEQKNTRIKLRLPYILNTPVSINSELEIFKKDSSFTNTQQKIETLIDIKENFKSGLSFTYKKSNTITESNNQDFTKKKYALEIEHNNFKNTKTAISIGIGNRQTQEHKINQQEIKLNSEYELKLNYRNKIYFRTINKILLSESVLDNEYNFIGGINTIRGVTENSIPTYKHFILNNEYRVNLTKTLLTHTVLDYGVYKNNDTNNYNKIIGFGIGFKLNTNKNTLSFVIANSKTNKEDINFNNSKIHLSLSTRF